MRIARGAGVLLGLLAQGAAAAQWLELLPADRPVTIEADGAVVSRDTLRFTAPPSRNWSVNISHLAAEGQHVAAGAVLAKFDSSFVDDRVRDLAGQLANLRGELKALREQHARDQEEEKMALAAAQSRSRKAERKAEQPAELIASVDYRKLVEEKRIARDLLQRARARLPLAAKLREAARLALEARIRERELEQAAAKQELESLTILAPRPGLVIVGRDYQREKLAIGAQAHPGLTVVELADDAALMVRAEVPEHLAARVAEGQRARVRGDSAGGAELAGRVASVANTVRRKSRSSPTMVRDVVVHLDEGPTPGLRLGMSVRVTLSVALRENALAVPASALAYRDGRPGVELRRGWTPVTLGERSEEAFVVEDGLAAGDEARL